jgi:hypothetical protein
MALIKIEINTEKENAEGFGLSISQPNLLALSKPIVLISTIKLTRELKQKFKDGAGQSPRYVDEVDYDDLKHTMKDFDGPNRLIVTSGGLIAFQAAAQWLKTSGFVSLLASAPSTLPSLCLGGIVVSGFNANRSRVSFLVAKGQNVGAIGLFCNPKSAMNQGEENDWKNNIVGVNRNIIHGGSSAGKNNPNNYPTELANADQYGITTLVISADPFFFRSREKLIVAANGWVAAGAALGITRYVCYPFDDYSNSGGTPPTAGTASWWGGSLLDAYEQLGTTAALALNSTTPTPFGTIPDTWGDF